jgi:hypothetical protein
MNKKGAGSGESILMIYRILLIIFICLIILGSSAFVFSYNVDIKNTEASILSRKIVNCFKENAIDLDYFKNSEDKNKILNYCGIYPNERFYVELSIYEKMDKIMFEKLISGEIKLDDLEKKSPDILKQGDSGLEWIRTIYRQDRKDRVNDFEKYNVGYYFQSYNFLIKEENNLEEGVISLEIFVKNDE